MRATLVHDVKYIANAAEAAYAFEISRKPRAYQGHERMARCRVVGGDRSTKRLNKLRAE
jgi:hypothetical protein